MAGFYRPVPHTADLALEVEADTLEDLFRCAALGMFELIQGGGPGAPGLPVWRRVRASGTDYETLLVAWLGELLYAHSAEGLLLHEIRDLRIGEREATGEVALVPLGSTVVEREIKGVTYHDLVVERRDGRWRARIVFDV